MNPMLDPSRYRDLPMAEPLHIKRGHVDRLIHMEEYKETLEPVTPDVHQDIRMVRDLAKLIFPGQNPISLMAADHIWSNASLFIRLALRRLYKLEVK